ncbi:glutathione S-transferase U19-like [Triticum dicoccoides]|uniref:glutathione S-transferase U19-like n=1 Tax=Triticum dicoccoides TaxID=85692 RepID=UPI00188E345B|nr:glutathione S-transferase U19-like [Triticum dicoccoides]
MAMMGARNGVKWLSGRGRCNFMARAHFSRPKQGPRKMSTQICSYRPTREENLASFYPHSHISLPSKKLAAARLLFTVVLGGPAAALLHARGSDRRSSKVVTRFPGSRLRPTTRGLCTTMSSQPVPTHSPSPAGRTRTSMADNMVPGESEVVCVDFWVNLFGMRVLIALRELGVSFEYIEEDLRVHERSDLVLRMNPVHRMVPILIHRGRPICNSINILQYIDEVWGHRHAEAGGTPLLPADPLQRASARFWADFVDHKVFNTEMRLFKSKGDDEKEAAKGEIIRQLRQLEGALGDKNFFSGDEFGFLDIVAIPLSSMFRAYEQLGKFDLEVECPKLMRWEKRCKERESVKSTLPDEEEVYRMHKKWYGIE